MLSYAFQSRAEFPRTRQRFYRAMGGGSAYSEGGERGRGQNERQRGGGCAKPLRGQAPETPKRLLHSRFASATHYKLEDFVAGTLADAPNLPVSQIFTLDFHGTHRASGSPLKIKVGSFLPDTLPSRQFLLRHYTLCRHCSLPTPTLFKRIVSVLPSFRELQAVPNFAGNTYKHRANECRMELAPIMPSAADVQPS